MVFESHGRRREARFFHRASARVLGAAMGLSLGASAACLEHRTAPNCEFEVPVGTQEPGEECMLDEDCVDGTICFEDVCVGQGRLRVSLGWTVKSDFDLHVQLPSGDQIFFQNDVHPTGALDVDDCVLVCANPGGTHVENVFFNDFAELGTYVVWVVNYDGNRAGSYFIEVEGEGTYQRWEGNLPAVEGAESRKELFIFDP